MRVKYYCSGCGCPIKSSEDRCPICCMSILDLFKKSPFNKDKKETRDEYIFKKHTRSSKYESV